MGFCPLHHEGEGAVYHVFHILPGSMEHGRDAEFRHGAYIIGKRVDDGPADKNQYYPSGHRDRYGSNVPPALYSPAPEIPRYDKKEGHGESGELIDNHPRIYPSRRTVRIQAVKGFGVDCNYSDYRQSFKNIDACKPIQGRTPLQRDDPAAFAAISLLMALMTFSTGLRR